MLMLWIFIVVSAKHHNKVNEVNDDDGQSVAGRWN